MMKNLLFLLLFTPGFLFASSGNPTLDAITAALGSGNVETLSKYFADNVQISIQDKEKMYSKTEAMEAVRTFFAGAKPQSFSEVHKGTSRGTSDQYCIGNLAATSGTYRVYLYLKVNGSAITIQEIRLDKE